MNYYFDRGPFELLMTYEIEDGRKHLNKIYLVTDSDRLVASLRALGIDVSLTEKRQTEVDVTDYFSESEIQRILDQAPTSYIKYDLD